MTEDEVCWMCDSDRSIIYRDVLGLFWCEPCFDREYGGAGLTHE